jgi:hypothetical protein
MGMLFVRLDHVAALRQAGWTRDPDPVIVAALALLGVSAFATAPPQAIPVLAELTLPFCAIGGRLIAQKKGEIASEIARARRAITELGARLVELRKIELPEFTDERQLVVVDKVSVTPSRYPRRPGIPAKRPIS